MDIFLVWVAIVYFNKNLSSKFKKHILSLTGIHFDNIWQNKEVCNFMKRCIHERVTMCVLEYIVHLCPTCLEALFCVYILIKEVKKICLRNR